MWVCRLSTAVAVALVCQGCLGASAEQRRTRGTTFLIAGAAMTAVAVGVSMHYRGDRCREGPGYAPGNCFLPQLGAVALGVTGAAVALTGAINMLPGPETRATGSPTSLAQTAAADDAACSVWQSSYQAEPDRVRRQALIASRPSHCAPAAP